MAEELALENLKNCLVNKENYTMQIENAKNSIARNNETIEDFNELIRLKRQAKTSIVSRYTEKIAELLEEMPNDMKIVLSNSSLYGSASRANLSLDFLGKRFFLLNNGIPLSPANNNEEQNTTTFAKNIANNMEKLIYSKDMNDVFEIYNEYKLNESTVPEILIEREMEKYSNSLINETKKFRNKISICKNEIQLLEADLKSIKKAGIIEKILNFKYVRSEKLILANLYKDLNELNVKLAKAKKDEREFNTNSTAEREKITKNVYSSLNALEKFVQIAENLTNLRLEHDNTYNTPIENLEERKKVFVKNNEENEEEIAKYKQLISKNDEEIKITLKDIYKNEELTKKLLTSHGEWGTDVITVKAIEFVKDNYKKELSSKITTLLK